MTVDAHVHIWDVNGGSHGVEYPWLTPSSPVLYRTYTLDDIAPELQRRGIDSIVLVQASDSSAETDALVDAAASTDLCAAVVGWLPLDDPELTAEKIEAARSTPALVGVRHLIHVDADPEWLLRDSVAAGLDLLADAGLTFDAVAETPRLLEQVVTVARRHPDLTIVLDHIGKPPIASGSLGPWADQLTAVANCPNVVAKLSGLATVSGGDVSSAAWQPSVDHALSVFGPDRLMFGGDWPFTLTAATYEQVWDATSGTLHALSPHELEAVLSSTARRVYSLERLS